MSDRTDLWRYLFIQTARIYEDFPPPMEFLIGVEGKGKKESGKRKKGRGTKKGEREKGEK